jgi:hypothetical protein
MNIFSNEEMLFEWERRKPKIHLSARIRSEYTILDKRN